MKRLSLAVFAALVFIGAFPPSVTHVENLMLTAELGAQADPARIAVYITKSGEKYHKDGCSSLRRSRIPVSLKAAVQRGFGACKICRPPTIER